MNIYEKQAQREFDSNVTFTQIAHLIENFLSKNERDENGNVLVDVDDREFVNRYSDMTNMLIDFLSQHCVMGRVNGFDVPDDVIVEALIEKMRNQEEEIARGGNNYESHLQ